MPLPPDPVICDCGAETEGLTPVEEAVRRGLDLCWPVTGDEAVPLHLAHGRVLLRAIKSRAPLPLFDHSAMDGYALRLDDLSGEGPWALPVSGRIAAGESGVLDWPRGSAIRIMTGAPVPAGCDAVIMQEAVQREAGLVRLGHRPETGANIRRAGEDLAQGAVLLPAGRMIDPRAAALLAAAGQRRVVVRRCVRVAVFSTGSELRMPGERLGPGQIWNANRYHLMGALQKPWVEMLDLGAVPDNPDALLSALEKAVYGADLVVTTGGVSVGEEDHMPAALARAGGEVHSMKLALRPGKPLTIGRVGKTVYLGLPGNPVSAFVSWHIFGARLLEALAGMTPGSASQRRTVVRAGFTMDRRPGRCEFLPARIAGRDGPESECVQITTRAVSHRLAILAEAEGLVQIPAGVDHVAEGDLLEFLPF
ncbi:MAG: gephyrin-like molybdotransferase Glp [Pseudorhodobacter sp.]